MSSNQDRRQFLKGAAKGTLGLITLSVIPLSLTACSDEEKVDTSAMANLGPLEEFKKGPFPKKVDYNVSIKDAWVTQEQSGFVYVANDKENNELLIMSPICTHLGCTASESNEQQSKNGITFYCPCHGGEYDEHGINIGGPPPRPLDVFKPFIKDGNVYISVLSPMERK
jgi:menaquinol-cytochrome c reductase iron-sulfur subunit